MSQQSYENETFWRGIDIFRHVSKQIMRDMDQVSDDKYVLPSSFAQMTSEIKTSKVMLHKLLIV